MFKTLLAVLTDETFSFMCDFVHPVLLIVVTYVALIFITNFYAVTDNHFIVCTRQWMYN